MRVRSLLNYHEIRGFLAASRFWLLAVFSWFVLIAAGLCLLAFGLELFL